MLYRHVITGELFTDDELKDEFSDYLDKSEGDINIVGMLYTASETLWALNPELFNELYFDWLEQNGHIEERGK